MNTYIERNTDRAGGKEKMRVVDVPKFMCHLLQFILDVVHIHLTLNLSIWDRFFYW